MNERPHQPVAAPGLTLDDIYHVLFRHKWKILIIWAIGIAAAAFIWKTTPVFYKSDSKIQVQYVVENKAPALPGASGDANLRSADPSGEGIINSELQILTSYDLALDVADMVGVEKILAKNGGGSDRYAAASVIGNGLRVEPVPRSPVIAISFRNQDLSIVQPVLEQVIASYQKKHVEIHLSPGAMDDFLTQQLDQTRNQLAQTEQELRQAKGKLGIYSIEEAKKYYSENIARIQRELDDAQTDLVGRMVIIQQMTNNTAAAAAAAQADSAETNAPVKAEIPKDIIEQHQRITRKIQNLEKRRDEMELSLTSESPLLKGIQDELVANEKSRALLETKYPDLANEKVVETITRAQSGGTAIDIQNELLQVRAIEARIAIRAERLADLKKKAAALDDAEGHILELQRKHDSLEQNYRQFQASLERRHFGEAVGNGRIQNIAVFQKPSPAYKDMGKTSKKLALLLAATFGGALALAFALELYFDRTIKRPVEIEKKLGLPLFLSIPRSRFKGAKLLGGSSRKLIGQGNGKETGQENGTALVVAAPADANGVQPWSRNHELRPYFEGLRDRLIMSFELRNLTHNPKLVAVTSCRSGSGVSTIASGLAASLSETGEGNVLLVDMNDFGQGSAHYFHKGKLESGLDDALVKEKRESLMVQDNLYVVSEAANNEQLPRVLHKRFSSLLPRLKASDYDYIIFDMPPVTQISPTSKLARFMDIVFMVVESEKTDKESLQRATALLDETNAHIGFIMNKTKDYIPKPLRHDV